jgi:hypothetical protein
MSSRYTTFTIPTALKVLQPFKSHFPLRSLKSARTLTKTITFRDLFPNMSKTESAAAVPTLRSQAEFFMTGIAPIDSTPGEQCTICWGELDQDVLKILSCKHAFHCNCILPWFHEDNVGGGSNTKCPTCRTKLYQDTPSLSKILSDRSLASLMTGFEYVHAHLEALRKFQREMRKVCPPTSPEMIRAQQYVDKHGRNHLRQFLDGSVPTRLGAVRAGAPEAPPRQHLLTVGPNHPAPIDRATPSNSSNNLPGYPSPGGGWLFSSHMVKDGGQHFRSASANDSH